MSEAAVIERPLEKLVAEIASRRLKTPPSPSPTSPVPGLSSVIQGVAENCYSAPMSNSDYHAIRSHISHSGMVHLLRSPAHYRAYLENKGHESDKGVNIGTGAHCAILEPDRFDDQYVVYTGGRRQGKLWEAFAEENKGKVICSEREMAQITGMRDAVKSFTDYPLWDVFHSRSSEVEKSIFWLDDETDAGVRVRLDVLSEEAIFDVKTIDVATPRAVIYQVMQKGLDLQAVMYREGVKNFVGKELPFILVFIEDKPPHAIRCFPVGMTVLDNGRIKFRRGIKRFAELQAGGKWHAYLDSMVTLELPPWAMEIEEL